MDPQSLSNFGHTPMGQSPLNGGLNPEKCCICTLNFSVGEMVRAKNETDFYECFALIHSKCLESKYASNQVELKKQKDVYKLEKKVAHIHQIDPSNCQIFFEDSNKVDVPKSDRMKELEAQKSNIEGTLKEISEGQNCIKCFGKILMIPVLIFIVIFIVALAQNIGKKEKIITKYIESRCLDVNTIGGRLDTIQSCIIGSEVNYHIIDKNNMAMMLGNDHCRENPYFRVKKFATQSVLSKFKFTPGKPGEAIQMRIESDICVGDKERFELKNENCDVGIISKNTDDDSEDRYNYRLLPVENKDDTYKIFCTNCSSYVTVQDDPDALISHEIQSINHNRLKFEFSRESKANQEFRLHPMDYTIYMELKDIEFQDITEAQLAAQNTQTIDDDFQVLELVKDESACIKRYDDSNYKKDKDVSVEFNNFVLNDLYKNGVNTAIEIRMEQALPLQKFHIQNLKFDAENTVLNKFNGKTTVMDGQTNVPQLAEEYDRPFCFFPDTSQKLSVIKKELSYDNLKIKFASSALIKVYDKAQKKYHNEAGARAIIQNVLQKSGLPDNLKIPKDITGYDENTISVSLIEGEITIKDYKEANLEFKFE